MTAYSWPSGQPDSNDRLLRRFLAFPEADGTDGGALLDDVFQLRQPSVVKRAMADWFRAVVAAPQGMAHQFVEDETLKRVLSTTDAEGGYLIPPGFVPELVKDEQKLSQLYRYVRRVPVAQNSGEVPKVGTNAAVFWGSENTAMSEGDPAFGNETYTISRLNSLVKMSREVAQDGNPDIVGLVSQLFTDAIMEERDRVIVLGTGSGQPLGLYSASGITDVSVTTLTYDNLVELHESVDERYMNRPTCRWVFNQNVKKAVMKIKDNDQQPIFVRDPTATGFVPTLLGHPVSIESSAPNNFVFFGDLRYYYWFDRQTMALETTTEAGDAFAKHQVWLKVTERVDGKPVLPPTSPMARTRVLTGIS